MNQVGPQRPPHARHSWASWRNGAPSATPAAGLREAEFDKVRGCYTDGLAQRIWPRGDTGGARMIVEATSSDVVAAKLSALPLVRADSLQPSMIVPLER